MKKVGTHRKKRKYVHTDTYRIKKAKKRGINLEIYNSPFGKFLFIKHNWPKDGTEWIT